MEVKKLAWDSEFFNLRIGRADLSSAEDTEALEGQKKLLKDNYDLIYVFANHGIGLHSPGAKLIDEKVVFALENTNQVEYYKDVMIWNSEQGVTKDLLHLALVSGKYSRFKLDKEFPAGSYERLYTRWIEQSVNHIMATEVFCYMIDDKPKGLVTLDRKDGMGTIGLVAIHEECQNRGVGSLMMRHVINYAQQSRCEHLSVATQLNNLPACKLYEKNGFKIDSITDVWHWWL
jgi:dTDP-4-amino-4,6-dideoxy-D-galactose acyltransferase